VLFDVSVVFAPVFVFVLFCVWRTADVKSAIWSLFESNESIIWVTFRAKTIKSKNMKHHTAARKQEGHRGVVPNNEAGCAQTIGQEQHRSPAIERKRKRALGRGTLSK
jgi:hypothetical protein